MYASIDQARAAGATGDDAAVVTALGTARRLVDAYTSAWWEPTAASIVASVGADGLVLLPRVVRTVDRVSPVGGVEAAYPVSGYRVYSSDTLGQVDGVQLAAGAWADATVVGAEPWHGGYANLFGGVQRVTVTGTFGAAAPPPEVVDAAAALAAWRTTGGSLIAATAGGAGVVDTDDEGNAVTITLDSTVPAPRARTTGLEAADIVLQSLIRDALRIN